MNTINPRTFKLLGKTIFVWDIVWIILGIAYWMYVFVPTYLVATQTPTILELLIVTLFVMIQWFLYHLIWEHLTICWITEKNWKQGTIQFFKSPGIAFLIILIAFRLGLALFVLSPIEAIIHTSRGSAIGLSVIIILTIIALIEQTKLNH